MSDVRNEVARPPRRWPLIASLCGLAVVSGVIVALSTCLNAGDHARALNPLPPGAMMAPATYLPPLPPAPLIERVPGDVVFEGTPAPLSAVQTEKAFPNLRFERPTYIGHHEDGSDRLFVLEQNGVVHIFENRRTIAKTTVCLDISSKTRRRNNEEGLLALAVHPNVAENGYIYVHYSASNPRRGVIARFTLDKETLSIADPASEVLILEQEQPYGNHNGGALEFGPDGYLYITFGDGGSAGDPKDAGQDLGTWLGKMLRIDVDREQDGKPYALPPDNPYLTWEGAMPEIWALGLRNLWRFSFDRGSGLCIGGDVGQNKWEEINIIHKGCNYGWRVREGAHAYRDSEHPLPPYIDPILEYGRRDGVSVTGGHVYRGKAVPELTGSYIYGDYGTGNVWALRHDGRKATENELICAVFSISSFGEDRDGELYMCSFDKSIYTFKPRVARRSDQAKAFPMRLSDTGLFKSLSPLTPVSELIPYDVNVPLWSAHAGKHRWIMLPGEETITFSPDGDYQFPAGTIFVKHFEIEAVEGDPSSARPLETRVLLYRPDVNGWEGYTYVWTDDLSDAQLLIGDADKRFAVTDADGERVDRTWHFPSSSQCMNCHHSSAGYVLGFHTRQLNRDMTYASPAGDTVTENQLAALARIGLFSNAPEDIAALPAFPSWARNPVSGNEQDDDAVVDHALLEAQVRSYLHSNCSFCHNPMGPANAMIDLRAETDIWGMNAVDVDPMHGIRFPDDKIIKPGAPRESTLYTRMGSTDGGWAMPDIGHTEIDVTALARLARWIRALDE